MSKEQNYGNQWELPLPQEEEYGIEYDEIIDKNGELTPYYQEMYASHLELVYDEETEEWIWV